MLPRRPHRPRFSVLEGSATDPEIRRCAVTPKGGYGLTSYGVPPRYLRVLGCAFRPNELLQQVPVWLPRHPAAPSPDTHRVPLDIRLSGRGFYASQLLGLVLATHTTIRPTL